MSKPLSERVLQGDERAASRLMRLVDDGDPRGREELDKLYSHTGDAYVVGVTGNPGSGKSTLVDGLIGKLRERGDSVGVIAIDPTSPFSGGAILGDRVRMGTHATDPGVFIRSVATRGNLGGISRSTPAILQVLDAMGFDWIIVETVGVGQDEVDIAAFADTCCVVMVPGMGDDVQAAKAGLLEVADLFIVNKSDRQGAKRVVRELRQMLDLDPEDRTWTPPIVSTVATAGEGLDDLLMSIEKHRTSDGARAERRRRRNRHLTRLIAAGEITRRIDAWLDSEAFHALQARIDDGTLSPFAAADLLLEALGLD
jgi:LAO/AO transport system kinase